MEQRDRALGVGYYCSGLLSEFVIQPLVHTWQRSWALLTWKSNFEEERCSPNSKARVHTSSCAHPRIEDILVDVYLQMRALKVRKTVCWTGFIFLTRQILLDLFFSFMRSIMSLISTVHLRWNQQQPQPWSCSRLRWISPVCYVACLLGVCMRLSACGTRVLWGPYCDKSEACIATATREGVDDRRAPLTRGFEEAAVTLYPANSEYIVLERGC